MIPKYHIAPVENVPTTEKPWTGDCEKKPWDYRVCVAIPVLNTPETLEPLLTLLRMQTVRPFVMLIDTGSNDQNLSKIQSFSSEDVEVHSLRFNGVKHPSDFPAIAMDFAFSACRSPFLFATHADCYPRRKDLLESFLTMCPKKSPVVGYEITPRAHKDWKGMVSHTATMYDMKTMDMIGFGWSLRRLAHMVDINDHSPVPTRPNWPDTEILGNYILRHYDIKPHLVGSEENFSRTQDENIDHFRSFTSGKMYSPEYFKQAKGWFASAKKDAEERIKEWSN